jgi:acetoin utilization deacetylase AcuC-like enzyme
MGLVVRVSLYDDPLFRLHNAGPGHPERPPRLDAIRRGLRARDLERRLRLLSPREATEAELLRVHTPEHLARLRATAGHTVQFDADTRASPDSYQAALLAAGAVADAVDRALDDEHDRAFCAVRPPGHHAEADRAMGFCLLNNVAVGAAQALHRGISRVLILDFDVHHGNGTQAIFESEPRILYVSSHAYPFYPGTGSVREIGVGRGKGFTVNLPLPGGMGDAEYVRIYRDVVLPIAAAYDPELVLVSAGFDAHGADPLANMALTDAGFGALMGLCLEAAAGAARGRTVVVLEGGYQLDAIARSAAALVSALLGEAWPSIVPASGQGIDRLVRGLALAHAAHWPGLST